MAQLSHPRLDQPFVVGSIVTPVGEVPRVGTDLSWTDHWGTFLARWGVGRMDYRVDPGLYAVGEADAVSAVFVTANYKMSFDSLRKELCGSSAWILVLDTDGINVWCAAGKGTFSTEELVQRVQTSGLTEIASVIFGALFAPSSTCCRHDSITTCCGFGVIRRFSGPAGCRSVNFSENALERHL